MILIWVCGLFFVWLKIMWCILCIHFGWKRWSEAQKKLLIRLLAGFAGALLRKVEREGG
jgi:hypothetical protein